MPISSCLIITLHTYCLITLLLSPKLTSIHIKRSTDLDRTLMTAQMVLSGLYPPKDHQLWNPDLKWQPAAVHTIDVNNDLLFNFAPCPRADQMNSIYMATNRTWLDLKASKRELMKRINAGIGNGSAMEYGPEIEGIFFRWLITGFFSGTYAGKIDKLINPRISPPFTTQIKFVFNNFFLL